MARPLGNSEKGHAAYLPQGASIPQTIFRIAEETVKTMRVLRNVVGSAGLLFMGYVFVTALPDLKRYIRISTM